MTTKRQRRKWRKRSGKPAGDPLPEHTKAILNELVPYLADDVKRMLGLK